MSGFNWNNTGTCMVPYCLGEAAENLPLNEKASESSPAALRGKIKFRPNHMLEVTLLSQLPYYHGEINSVPQNVTTSLNKKDGSNQQISVDTALSVKAQWFPLGESNRITPPNVRRGERVYIWRVPDTELYFWSTCAADQHLRKLETVIWVFSGSSKETDAIDFDSCYFLEVSTHQGRIRLHTSKANKEPFEYDIELNTKEGKFTLKDSIANSLYLESAAKRWILTNADESFFHLCGKKMHINAPEEILMESAKITIKASGTTDISGGGSGAVMTGGSYSVKTGEYKVKAASFSFSK